MSLRAIASGVATARDLPPSTSGGEFVILARSLLAGRGDAMQAASLLRTWHATERVQEVAKTAVTQGGVDWGVELTDPAYVAVLSAFLQTLRTNGAFDAMLPSMLAVPLRSRFSIATVGLTAATVGAGSFKPISSAQFSSDEVTELKATCVVVVTNEFMRTGGSFAQAALNKELTSAIAAETDVQFMAILLSGVNAIAATGIDARSVRRDMQTALAALTTSNNSRLFCLMRPAMAKNLSTMFTSTGDAAFPTMAYNGGQLCGIPAITTDACPAGAIVIVDAAQVVASGDNLSLRTITQGDVIMDNAPDSPPSASTLVRNLWQRGEVGLVAERLFSAQVMASGAVVELAGGYADSPQP